MHQFMLAYEQPVNSQWTIDLRVGLGYDFFLEVNPANPEGNIRLWWFDGVAAFTKAELRRYYNRKKWAEQGKSVSRNAGHYVALSTGYAHGLASSPDFPLNGAMLTEIQWGAQWQDREWENWLSACRLGLGYASKDSYLRGSLYPVLDLALIHYLRR